VVCRFPAAMESARFAQSARFAHFARFARFARQLNAHVENP
jgi:hypothetical protein